MGKPPRFEVIYKDKKVEVDQFVLPAGKYFFISIDEELRLFLTKDGNSKSWTSIPSGYKDLATSLGALIDEYLSKNKNNKP